MNSKIILYILIFSLTVSLAIAPAGGGAAAGGSGGWVSSPASTSESSSSSSSSNGDGPFLYGLKCTDTGKLTFKQSPPIKPVVIESEDGENLTILGEWKGKEFTSQEAEIIEEGVYTLHDPKNGDKSVECPGLAFSCKVVELKARDCSYGEQGVSATFSLEGQGTSIDNVQLEFKEGNKFLKYNSVSSSPELKDLEIDFQDGMYHVTVLNSLEPSTLKLTYPECVGEYYVSSKVACSQEQQEVREETRVEEPVVQQPAPDSFFTKLLNFLRKLFG